MHKLTFLTCLLLAGCAHSLGSGMTGKGPGGSLEQRSASPATTPAGIATIEFRGSVDDMSAEFLSESFAEALKLNPAIILLVIDSPGGSIWAMNQMIRTVQESPVPVACIADGMAASAAAVLLEACDLRAATPMTLILFHGASGQIKGNEADIAGDLTLIRAINETMTLFVANRIGMPIAEFRELIRQDFWVGPVTAVEMNIIDLIAPDVATFRAGLGVSNGPK